MILRMEFLFRGRGSNSQYLISKVFLEIMGQNGIYQSFGPRCNIQNMNKRQESISKQVKEGKIAQISRI